MHKQNIKLHIGTFWVSWFQINVGLDLTINNHFVLDPLFWECPTLKIFYSKINTHQNLGENTSNCSTFTSPTIKSHSYLGIMLLVTLLIIIFVCIITCLGSEVKNSSSKHWTHFPQHLSWTKVFIEQCIYNSVANILNLFVLNHQPKEQ